MAISDEPALSTEVYIEAKLYAAGYASRADIFRMKGLGVHWDGKARIYEPDAVLPEGVLPPWVTL